MEGLPEQIKRVIIGMDAFGQPSRFLGKFLGNAWNYVSPADSDPAAPGQFSLRQAKDVYRIDQWSAPPAFYGVVGNPTGYSESVLLHNRLFDHYGKSGVFLPLQIDDLDSWFTYMESTNLSFQGLVVSSSFETELNSYLDRTTSIEESIDTLRREESAWVGVNTEWEAFLRPLMNRTTTLAGKRAVVLGGGDLARAGASALCSQKVQVILVAHEDSDLADCSWRRKCEIRPYSEFPIGADLLVVATSPGDRLDEELSSLPDVQLDFDLLYVLASSPGSSRLVHLAEGRGLETVGPVEMLVEQVAGQFREWTGIDPDRGLMREIINARQ
jgi:shikimate dehydrogenase